MTTVSEISVTNLAVKVKDPAIQKLLPTRYTPDRMRFVLKNTNASIACAIRRTLMSETPTIAMLVDDMNIVCNDGHVNPDIITKRVRLIPLDQDCPTDAVFELDAVNSTMVARDIKTGEFRIKRGAVKKLPFNENITFVTLKPGCSISITDITVHTAQARALGDGMHAVAFDIIARPLGYEMPNAYENIVGVPSRYSNPTTYEIVFTTNGNIGARKLAAETCRRIAKRVRSVKDILYSIEHHADEYQLVIAGETYTVGGLLMRAIHDSYPDIRAVTYTCDESGNTCTMRVRCDDDITTVFRTAIDRIAGEFDNIARALA